jgi:hypothetical protein
MSKKECILCLNSDAILYGDIMYNNLFCKDCYNKYSCFHCKNMNLEITMENKEIVNINYLPLYGHNFKLFCEECYNNEDVYYEEDDDLSVNIEEDKESYDSEFEYDIDDENEDNYTNDIYYIRRGKYDIYR